MDSRDLVPEADVKRMEEYGDLIVTTFGKPVAFAYDQGRDCRIDLNSPSDIKYVVIREDIAKGERIREYRLSGLTGGEWKTLRQGSCTGHKRIEVIKGGQNSAIRLEVLKYEGDPYFRSVECFLK